MADKTQKQGKTRDNRGLTDRQRAFCRLVAKGTKHHEAVIQAGYKTKDPYSYANKKLLPQPKIKAYITELRDKLDTADIADAKEVLTFLTDMMRGDIIAPKSTKQGIVDIEPEHGVREDAAKTLAKHHKLLVDRVEQTGSNEITITFDGDLKSWSE